MTALSNRLKAALVVVIVPLLILSPAFVLCLTLVGCPPVPVSASQPAATPVEVQWQEITKHRNMNLARTRTPKGWLVVMRGYDFGGITYIPDPEGNWALQPVVEKNQ